MVKGYIYEVVEGSLDFQHPVEAALFELLTNYGAIPSTLESSGTDLAKGSRGISFDAPMETAAQFNAAFTGSSVLASNLKIVWIEPFSPLSTGRSAFDPAAKQPPPQPPPAPGTYQPPVQPLGPAKTLLPQIDWQATWRKFAPYVALGAGGLFLWFLFKRREEA